MPFASTPSAAEAFAQGNFLIVLDSTERENKGDLIIVASEFTPDKAAFMIRHTSGFLCAPITSQHGACLELPQMTISNKDPQQTAYTISIDADISNSTEISARERSRTCRLLADPTSTPATFRRPGHVLPLKASDGGVRSRAAHTEAMIEFFRSAGKELVGVLAELVEESEDRAGVAEEREIGMMSRDGCLGFGERYGIMVVTIDDLKAYLER